jgi:hypothetical protein
MKAGRNSRFADVQGVRGLAIGESKQIDSHERVAEAVRQLGDQPVELRRLERVLWRRRRAILDEIQVIG